MNRRTLLALPFAALAPPIPAPEKHFKLPLEIRFKGPMPESVHEHYKFVEASYVRCPMPDAAYGKATTFDPANHRHPPWLLKSLKKFG